MTVVAAEPKVRGPPKLWKVVFGKKRKLNWIVVKMRAAFGLLFYSQKMLGT